MKLTNEVKVGMMVFMVILFLMVLTVKAGNFHFGKKGYEVKIQFKRIDGIALNAPVMLNGFEVGLVKKINILDLPDGAALELETWINEGVKLREGTQARVKNMGFMGEKYVSLSSGNGAGFLKAQSTIVGHEPGDLDQLLEDGQGIALQLKEVSQNINERLKVNQDHIDHTFAQVDSITHSLDERLSTNKENIDELIASLRNTAVNLDQMTYDLKLHPWKLMYRTKETRKENLKIETPTP